MYVCDIYVYIYIGSLANAKLTHYITTTNKYLQNLSSLDNSVNNDNNNNNNNNNKKTKIKAVTAGMNISLTKQLKPSKGFLAPMPGRI